MVDIKREYQAIKDNWDIRKSENRVLRRLGVNKVVDQQAELNASFVRILDWLSKEVGADRPGIYVNPDHEVRPSGEGFDYFGFEQTFRPDEEVLKERQRSYLRYFEGKEKVLDVACGRGEFLELLSEAGVEATGVDTNPDMVSRCREKGLTVEEADYREYLESLPDASLDGVFSAQFIEHIPFEEVDRFFKLAFRKLRPRGVFIAETINPYHPTAFWAFHVDPTHVNPLFPEVMEFVARSAGFGSVSTDYILPFGTPAEAEPEAPGGYSDFAVVGVKTPGGEGENGPGRGGGRMTSGGEAGGPAPESIPDPSAKAKALAAKEAELDAVSHRLTKVEDELAEKVGQIEEKQRRIESMVSSFSWRVTSLLRTAATHLSGKTGS